MCKSIEKKVRYISRVQHSYSRKNIEPNEYRLTFQDETGKKFVWREYDCHMNKPFKSDDWQLRDRMIARFIPKDEILSDGSQIVTHFKKI
tara:strand:- start:3436 stop:3705 length:270 start_codon:yes stop_codon:yes gene_type:complete